MKAFLISRPGDFGVLEEHWSLDPLLLPLPGGTLLDLHEAAFQRLGIREARVLRCHPAQATPDLAPLEEALSGRDIAWSVRGWPVAPFPLGWTLTHALLRQSLFLADQEALVFSVPAADPRGWVGPKVPFGFPPVETRSLQPLVWQNDGRLIAWSGPVISLGGTRDFYRASIRFLETMPPSPLGLKGIHRQARLEPPLSLGTQIHAAARSQLGPLVQLATGSRLEIGTNLSRTLVLTPTHFHRDQALTDRIVIGDSVVEPLHGAVVPLPHPH